MKNLIIFLCVALSFTNLSFFQIGQAQFTVFHALAILVLFCLVFLALAKGNLKFSKPPLFLVTMLYILIVNLVYLNTIKISSFIYSLVILGEILLLYNCIKKLQTKNIKIIIKTILVFYFINILVTSLFIKLKITPQGFMGEIFKIYNYAGRVRPYGFSDEPSYAALILNFSFFVLLKCDNFEFKATDLKWYVIAVVTILLTGSSYGYLLLAILLVYFVLKSKVVQKSIHKILKNKILTNSQLFNGSVLILVSTIVILNSIDLSENKSVQRLVDLYDLAASTDYEVNGTIKRIASTDGSASMRLQPSVHLIVDFTRSDLGYVLFGHGAGQSVPFFSRFYEGNVTILGFIPSFIYNYGIVGTFLFLMFFLVLFPRQKTILLILFFLFIFNADFNTQIFLYVLFTIMVSRQIEENSKTELKSFGEIYH